MNQVGGAVAVGEQPIKGLISPEAGARMSLAESLTNLVFAPITELKDVKCSGNWMWPAKLPGEGVRLVRACSAMCDMMKEIGVAVDGGKDSLSMAARAGEETVKAPGTLVISSYAPCTDIRKVITPDLKCPCNSGALIHIRFGANTFQSNRLGGTALAQCYSQIGDECADVDSSQTLANAFMCTQTLIKDQQLTAGHDVSDGGLITCILEMAFAGNCSVQVQLDGLIETESDALSCLFAEECGIVVECTTECVSSVLNAYEQMNVCAKLIGCSKAEYGPDAVVEFTLNHDMLLRDTVNGWRSVWEETSFELEKLQCDQQCAKEEQGFLLRCKQLPWALMFDAFAPNELPANIKDPPQIGIVRDEGSNGDREMAAAFHMAGFVCYDLMMQDFLDNDRFDLNALRGLAFVGGFSYADVLGSAKGWASAVMFNDRIRALFNQFYRREHTFSLGVCNGCQLMANIGWIGDVNHDTTDDNKQPKHTVIMEPNNCERFQSYFNTVRIQPNPAIMLKHMHNSVLGVWVSHGEGKFACTDSSILEQLSECHLIPMVYVDENGDATEEFPINPNGSKQGVAGICSPCGRHLALMPHPERCFLTWQWPDWNNRWPKKTDVPNNRAPWMKMFENAFDWCMSGDRPEK